MECMQCSYNNKDWAITCSNCGQDFKDNTEKELEATVIETPTENVISAYPYPGSIKYLENLQAEKKETSRQIWALYIGIMLLFFLFASSNLSKNLQSIMICGVLLLIITFIIIFIINMMSITNYYNIPMSKDKKNMHKCIFCGGGKIHKTFIVNSPLCTNHCSDCENFLFYKWQHIKNEN